MEKNLILVKLDSGLNLSIEVSGVALLVTLLILIVIGIICLVSVKAFSRSFEIEAAEFGLKNQKIKLRPNDTDRQIAYQIWVELSTRKIGLPIDLKDDVIAEIYSSWYDFFGVTRELIKDVPASKFRRADTEKIIRLSIEVLNEGLRPHMTTWQARYRHWYEQKLKENDSCDVSPQDLQKTYPEFSELSSDMLEVNGRLMAYREGMYSLIR